MVQNQHGFTLIELLIVIAIFMILASLSLWFSIDFFRTFATTSEETSVVSTLSKARAQSLSNINRKPHGVRITPTTYTIFEGADWASRVQAADQVIAVNSSIHPTSSTDIVFAQLTGNAMCSTGCTITMTGGSYNKTINVNAEGAILW